MPKRPAETLDDFLQRQPAAALAAVLIELAGDHEVVRRRLVRMQLADRPDKLEASFKKGLAAWRRSTKCYGYRESRDFGRELQMWLDQVARELAPKDPPAAVVLFESFIESDAEWFERSDDSDGSIGDAVRSACRRWLEAAALCETPAQVWPGRLLKLAEDDEYGAREELLRRADLLLAEPALRELVALFEARLADALRSAPEAQRAPHEVFRIPSALSLLSEALHDPDVMVRAALMHSPRPNALQREAFARAYLDADRPADAMTWLQDPWDDMERTQQSLLADALGRLGRFDESAPIRQQMFERTLAVFDLQQWLEHLPPAAHAEAQSHARRLALDHQDAAAAAALLLEIGDAEAAEARLIADRAGIAGDDYPRLVPLAALLRTHGCPRGETVVYRALLRGILERAYARAYGHAARYWSRLREIADACDDLAPLPSHGSFEAEIRARHGRKPAFRAYVNGKRNARLDEADDISA
jgi:hypothetical protein